VNRWAVARAAAEAQGGSVRLDESSLGGARFVMLVTNMVTETVDAH